MTSRIEIATKKSVFGWSVIVDFTLGSNASLRDLKDGKASLLWGQDLILSIHPRQLHPHQEASGQAGYRLQVDATATASEAESIGIRLAYAVLRLAIERRWGVGLAWEDAPLPCRVVDRTRSKGIQASGFASVIRQATASELTEELEAGFSAHQKVPQRVLLSMEFFAASYLESNARVSLVMQVSALEALAVQEDLSAEVGDIVAKMADLIEASCISDGSLKQSLKGQVRGLTRESARRAIKRLLTAHGMTDEDIKVFETAYTARSKIVHEGQRVPDLASILGSFDGLMHKLYAKLLV